MAKKSRINFAPAILEDTIKNFINIKEKYELARDNIVLRIKYILKMISRVCADGDEFYLDDYVDVIDNVHVNKYNVGFNPINEITLSAIFLKDGTSYNFDGYDIGYAYSFPRRWIFEDFEDELINGKKIYDINAKKAQNNLLKKAKLIKSAKSKLTPEELKALGVE